MNQEQVVVVQTDDRTYPTTPPFHPDVAYPEYGFGTVGLERNAIYQAVRGCFRLAGLDSANYGTSEWNPLGKLINPGEIVLLKPNLVKENHPRDPNGWKYVLTHGSIIRAVADYVWKALRGQGRIIVADAPQTDSAFRVISRLLALHELCDFYRSQGIDFEVVDLRQEEWSNRDGVIMARQRLSGDPRGYVAFNLGDNSEFVDHSGAGRYYGADYDAGEVNRHHSEGRHEYLIAGTAVHADVIFNLPKLKTHKKAGITVTLKNLVGINGDKNWLPHHTEGDPSVGGDERPNLGAKGYAERSIVPYFRWLSLYVPWLGPWIHRLARRAGSRVFGDTEEVIRSGNWWGNDTTWRMCLDLNKIVFYGRPDGRFNPPLPEYRRRHYALVDGVVAGEGGGPMNPDPIAAGVLVFGIHPASVDAVCAYLMGYDPEKIPIIRQAFRCRHYPMTEWDWRDVMLISNLADWNGQLPDIPDEATFHFEPHVGWKGHIERDAAKQ